MTLSISTSIVITPSITTFSIMTLSITTFSIMTLNITFSITKIKQKHSVLLFQIVVKLSVTNKPFMLSVIMLNVVMLSVRAPQLPILKFL
jgi:hypothetical protein